MHMHGGLLSVTYEKACCFSCCTDKVTGSAVGRGVWFELVYVSGAHVFLKAALEGPAAC